MRTQFSRMDKLILESRNKLLTKNKTNLLEKPNIFKFCTQDHSNTLKFSVTCMQGWRCSMEDVYSAKMGLSEKLKDWSYFAVFDGHYGDRVAQYCCDNLLANLLNNNLENDVKNAILKGFLDTDLQIRDLISKVREDQSGTTSIVAIISSQKIYIANLGDSRAVFYSEQHGISATKDHKPFMPDEKIRIEKAGGVVKKGRINGAISVSRTLGDFSYKSNLSLKPNEQLISSEPEIFIFDRQEGDKFLILASDGVWRTFKTSELCSFIEERLSKNMDLSEIGKEVLDTSFSKGSFDNMCVIIVVFSMPTDHNT